MKIYTKVRKYLSLILMTLGVGFAPAICVAQDALTQEVTQIQETIQKGIIKNLVTIAALAGFIMCAISAAGGNVGQVVVQNMGYVAFLVFGSGLIMKFIGFAQSGLSV